MMRKKDYMKPTMRVVCLQHHSIICGSPYSSIQTKNSTNDNDNPDYDSTSSGNIWDAN